MFPQTLPLTEFKKDYKFIWYLQGIDYEAHDTSGTGRLLFYKENPAASGYLNTVANLPYALYVSQLTEQVQIPDDEFEIETLPQGPVEYQMPKKVKLNDIQVTYLEDSANSVYNFHKSWFNAIRGGKKTTINSPSFFAAKGIYIEFEDTLTSAQYAMMYNITNAIAGANKLSVNTNQKLSAVLSKVKPELPYNAVPTSWSIYPKIYPKKITRTPGNHQGDGLSKVTVTYARIPQFAVRTSALQIYNVDKWVDVEDSNYNTLIPRFQPVS